MFYNFFHHSFYVARACCIKVFLQIKIRSSLFATGWPHPHTLLVWLGVGFFTALTAQWIRFIILVQSSKPKTWPRGKMFRGKGWNPLIPTSTDLNRFAKQNLLRVAAYLAFTNVLFLMEDPQIILLGSVNQIFQFPPLTQYGRSRKSFLREYFRAQVSICQTLKTLSTKPLARSTYWEDDWNNLSTSSERFLIDGEKLPLKTTNSER